LYLKNKYYYNIKLSLEKNAGTLYVLITCMFKPYSILKEEEEERSLSLNGARSLSLNGARSPFQPSPVLPIAASIQYFEARLW